MIRVVRQPAVADQQAIGGEERASYGRDNKQQQQESKNQKLHAHCFPFFLNGMRFEGS